MAHRPDFRISTRGVSAFLLITLSLQLAGPVQAQDAGADLEPAGESVFTLDQVDIAIRGAHLPASAIVTSDPGAAIQVATATDLAPYREFSMTAIPFGTRVGTELLPAAAPGMAAEYREILRNFRLEQGALVEAGPVLGIFNQAVPGLRSRVELAVLGDALLPVVIDEWVVEAGERLWIVRLSQEPMDGQVNTQDNNLLEGLVIQSSTLDRPTSVTNLPVENPQPELPAAQAGSDLPTPPWWTGDCDYQWYYDKSGGLESFRLGAVYAGMPACGPRPYADGGVDVLVRFFPGAHGQYEWECVELSMRFLYLRYGINPYPGNGKDVVNNYTGTRLAKIANGAAGKAPKPGDVLSYGPTSTFGHTSVVTASSVDDSGNGTITIIEQNSKPSGSSTLTVSNWWVNGNAGAVIGWLHDQVVTRRSVASDGTQGNGASSRPSTSADGRYVAFESAADNLVSGDTNGLLDIFVHDRQSGGTSRVSVATDGTQGDCASRWAAISGDGSKVAFISCASTLGGVHTPGNWDLFIHDRLSGQTTLVSASVDITSNENPYGPSLSTTGRYVAFASTSDQVVAGDTNGFADIFVYDGESSTFTLVSLNQQGPQGNDHSWQPSISGDGQTIAFMSFASNLVVGDALGWQDVFVRDLVAVQTVRVSVASDGFQGDGDSWQPSISADGSTVAFASQAANLVPGDLNSSTDVFIHVIATGATSRVSVSSLGAEGNGASSSPSLSQDGRHAAFQSAAGNLVHGDTNNLTDIFVRDRQTGVTTRLSLSSGGTQGNASSERAAISADGKSVAFDSEASNLVSGDTNGARDAFMRELIPDVFPPVVKSITRLDPNPTGLGSVRFTVTFSEPVTGVDVPDFGLAVTGVVGAAISGVSGSGEVYTVTVGTGDGCGTIRLDVSDNDTIQDAAKNPLGGKGSGNGNYTGGEVFTVQKVYILPVPLSPAGTLNGVSRPTFEWGVTPGATSYSLAVYSYTAVTYLLQSSVAVSSCSSTRCTFPAPINFSNGNYKFKVLAFTACGVTPYSTWLNFTISGVALPPPTPLNPGGTATTHRPTFQWSMVPGASFYRLAVYSYATASYPLLVSVYPTCVSGICSYTSASIDLPNGSYKFKVLARSATEMSPYSPFKSFTVSSNLPLAPTLIAPTGTVSANPPQFQWNAVSGATKYRLAVYQVATASYILQVDVLPSACSGTVCNYTPATALASGSYRFKMLAYNAYGASGYSPFMSFTMP